MNFRNLSIGKQLGLSIFVAVLFLVVSGVMSSYSLRNVNDTMRSLYNDRVVPLRGLKTISDAYAVNVVDAVNKANGGLITAAEALSDVRRARDVIATEWRAFMATRLTDKEAVLAREANQLFEPANQALDDLEAALQSHAGPVEGALHAYDGELYASIDPISNKINELINLQLREAERGMHASDARYQATMLKTIALGIAAVVISVVVAFIVTRGITGPLGRAVEQAKAVAAGDLTARVEVNSTNEIGQLLLAQKAMVDGLTQVVSEVRRNAENVSTASEQIAQGNVDLSKRTEEQASALEETSASMEEMGASAKQNADNAATANQLASDASSVAKKGGDVVGQVVNTMREINDSSTQISNIIGVIDGIAFQTNILALNASVEAARAGERGRGFAVVAVEVRNLAQRSAEAAREIKDLIEASVERVAQGSTLVDQAGTTMQQIVSAITNVSDIVDEMSSASTEQSTAVGQVSVAVSQIDRTTQQNASLVEESAAAAESLRTQSVQLVKVVQQFRLVE
ncbi:methyl-accepting chemotaxis protein with syntaxin/epimorphin coiled-coil domain [Alcanivorax sp. 521-1]|uniref:Methyl-accepting chemotaxis protein with syntaxin/epimorphin coiled-coil domain n=1 Tax=Alloalcanivorax profundimaris TaxID=2735259 RepID=A0ABS0AR26_9GAMM|nr:methyl-accepting chemotaxis protein [Alloalcanivorax profundimaris]MBF5055720.1 methyl-accepting chemotaxis protein with syntaxin/epimorphin coiled-coil domain [Alloalcanivorax profundimaris]